MAKDLEENGARQARTLTGAEKVGVLLLALGQERASELLKRFDPEELNIVKRSTEMMPTSTAAELNTVIEEFQHRLERGVPFVGRPDDIKLIVSQVISENRSAADATSGGEPSKAFWPRLSELGDDILIPYLQTQNAQLIAYILFRLGGDRAALLLGGLPTAARNDLVGRLLGLREVSPFVAEALEAAIEADLFESDTGASTQRTAVASILSNFDYAQTAEVLEHIAGFRPKDSAAIKKMIFKFSDLDKLPAKPLTSIMDGIAVERVVIALQGMPSVFIATVLATLSPRARRMAEAELRNGVNATPADLAASRRLIVDGVLKLAADGTIDLSMAVAPEAAAG